MPVLSNEARRAKLRRLAEAEGFASVDQLIEAAATDSVCPAICCNPLRPECDHTAEMEPDQDAGWCEEYQANTLVSVLVLSGLI